METLDNNRINPKVNVINHKQNLKNLLQNESKQDEKIPLAGTGNKS